MHVCVHACVCACVSTLCMCVRACVCVGIEGEGGDSPAAMLVATDLVFSCSMVR